MVSPHLTWSLPIGHPPTRLYLTYFVKVLCVHTGGISLPRSKACAPMCEPPPPYSQRSPPCHRRDHIRRTWKVGVFPNLGVKTRFDLHFLSTGYLILKNENVFLDNTPSIRCNIVENVFSKLQISFWHHIHNTLIKQLQYRFYFHNFRIYFGEIKIYSTSHEHVVDYGFGKIERNFDRQYVHENESPRFLLIKPN